MNRIWRPLTLGAIFTLQGCQTHLAFLEQDHIGLKVKFTADGTTPANIDIGAERVVAAMIPQIENDNRKADGTPAHKRATVVTGPDENNVVTYTPGDGELTSLYNRFEANVGLFDPFEVKHFLATGIAAENLAAQPNALDLDIVPGTHAPNSGDNSK